jgi:DNA-binding CsgD family transcriptional regulator
MDIRDIERYANNVSSLDQLKEDGYEVGGECKELIDRISRLEIDIALRKFTVREQKICNMFIDGYQYNEICKSLKVGYRTVKATLKRLCDIIR